MENKELSYSQTKKINPIEKKELSVETSTVTAEDFISMIYNRDRRLADKRFFRKDEGGVFKYFDAKDILSGTDRGSDKFYSFVRTKDLIVGICELQKNPFTEKNSYWVKMVSIDEEYQNQGFASKLVAEVMRFANENNMILEASSYTDKGYQKLKPLWNRLSKEIGVEFIDTEGRI